MIPQNSTTGDEALDAWYRAVQEYSIKKLTFESDRLPALAGIAARVSKTLGLTYLAGIWKEDMARGLCWYVQWSDDDVQEKKAQGERGPSWSWVSTRNVLHWKRDPSFSGCKQLKLNIHATHIEEEHAGSFGRGRKCRLDVEGRLWQAVVITSDSQDHQVSGLYDTGPPP